MLTDKFYPDLVGNLKRAKFLFWGIWARKLERYLKLPQKPTQGELWVKCIRESVLLTDFLGI
jgi:hypothetical protein